MPSPPPRRQAVGHLLDRGARSGPRATQGCRYRLQFGGCRLPRGHTGSWHCNQIPRFQVDRAQSSYHAANLEKGFAGRHGDPAPLLSKHTPDIGCVRLCAMSWGVEWGCSWSHTRDKHINCQMWNRRLNDCQPCTTPFWVLDASSTE